MEDNGADSRCHFEQAAMVLVQIMGMSDMRLRRIVLHYVKMK